MRCTVLTLTPCAVAITRTPGRCQRAGEQRRRQSSRSAGPRCKGTAKATGDVMKLPILFPAASKCSEGGIDYGQLGILARDGRLASDWWSACRQAQVPHYYFCHCRCRCWCLLDCWFWAAFRATPEPPLTAGTTAKAAAPRVSVTQSYPGRTLAAGSNSAPAVSTLSR